MSGTGDKKQLGKILLKQRAVSPVELDRLLEEQKAHPGQRLASAAASAGVSEVDLLRALSEQHQVPGIDLTQVVVPVSNLKLVPLEVARQYLILPFSLSDEQILLAMADPQDQRVIDEIEFVTGRTVGVYVALHEPLRKVIDDAYAVADTGAEYYVGPNASPEYLASIGVAAPATSATPAKPAPPKAPPRPPPPPPSGAAAKVPPPPKAAELTASAEDFSDLFADDEAPSPPAPQAKDARGRAISALDPAFESRVAPLPVEEPRAKRTGTERKVLVVDDEDDIRRLLKRVLTDRGFVVIEASRGSDALQMVRDHMPDLILLDAMLPEIHGFDICRRIKGSQKYGHIPIIMISAVYRGWRFAEDLKDSYGVNGFLEKPFKIADVLSAVDAVLDGSGAAPVAPRDEDAISEPAGEALTSGIEAYKRGDLDTAIAHLKRGLTIDPLAFRLHYHLGLLYGRRENVFEAIAAMEAAVDLSPKNFAALKNLAVLYQRAGFKHKAIEIWERALGSAQDDETRLGIKEHLMSLL